MDTDPGTAVFDGGNLAGVSHLRLSGFHTHCALFCNTPVFRRRLLLFLYRPDWFGNAQLPACSGFYGGDAARVWRHARGPVFAGVSASALEYGEIPRSSVPSPSPGDRGGHSRNCRADPRLALATAG